MAVTHRSGVVNFDAALERGGTHIFEISADEMPELAQSDGLEDGAVIKSDGVSGGVWAEIAARIAEKGGECRYRKNAKGGYDVTITIPAPNGDL